MGAICLVSCVGKKQSVAVPARELYFSPWFRKARSYVESTGLPWFVLSAMYGLVHPDRIITPYELTLNNMPATDRRRWARGVLTQMEPILEGVSTVVFLAGPQYREFLVPPLHLHGLHVSVPMEGLGIGEQLKWLTREISC